MKTPICKCNMCDNFYVDTNPQVNAIEFHVSEGVPELIDKKCPECKTDGYLIDVDRYYQPDVGLDEIGQQFNALYSFEVFLRKETAEEWFPDIPIKTYYGDDIEEPSAVELNDLEF